MKAVLPWAFWIFVAFYVVTAPTEAAAFLHTAAGWLGALGNGLSTVVTDTTNSA
ncbi:hypothetical protein [Pseudofrankia inefficax]|uniref:Uncharacterized protein n=1 Tax=Pseudofrankia inefficax (strain DSM 45817 / CECT 9037 / DDB 130130 / EuI1c) TaxID=298654 RepID=E3ITY6_PSEI1|nr:hypothetical protein [Pseudofrankia inefficax]ADP81179.1 hypothetical protein FraEuI1c_3161 [Pseudofrankia inefficax]